ncbi:MAG: biotin transporter BioY [Chloroflexi bacterium]|nr:biotin transporter BioY [Chloroflexota bacterium]
MQSSVRPVTLVEALIPRPTLSLSKALLRDALLVIGFSALVAVFARISIYLPFTPVPITGQTLAVLLTGAALGSKRGALALLAYIAGGAAGLPVFAGAKGGILALAGPSGGYIWGFLVAAFVVGLLAERGWDRKVWTTALAMLIGNVIIYLFGLPQLALVVGALKGVALSLNEVLAMGLLPFIPGDIFKLAVAAAVLPSAWWLLRRR